MHEPLRGEEEAPGDRKDGLLAELKSRRPGQRRKRGVRDFGRAPARAPGAATTASITRETPAKEHRRPAPGHYGLHRHPLEPAAGGTRARRQLSYRGGAGRARANSSRRTRFLSIMLRCGRNSIRRSLTLPTGRLAGMIRRLTGKLISAVCRPAASTPEQRPRQKPKRSLRRTFYGRAHTPDAGCGLHAGPEFIKGMVTILPLRRAPKMIESAETLEHRQVNRRDPAWCPQTRSKWTTRRSEICLVCRGTAGMVREPLPRGDYLRPSPSCYFREVRIKRPELQPEAVPRKKASTSSAPKGIKVFAGLPQAGRHHLQKSLLQSFRQYPRVLLSSLGIKERCACRMTGHQVSWSHTRYDFPSEWKFPQSPRHRGPKTSRRFAKARDALCPSLEGGWVRRTGRRPAPACALEGMRRAQQRHNERPGVPGRKSCPTSECGAKDRYALRTNSAPRDGAPNRHAPRTIPPTTGLKENLLEADQSLAGGPAPTSHNGDAFLPSVGSASRPQTDRAQWGEQCGEPRGPPHLEWKPKE